MSKLIVEVVEVADKYPHPDPATEKLEIIKLKGWEVLVQKNLVNVGDKVVYFPPGTVMQQELSDKLGITNYLGMLPKERDGSRKPGRRVMAAFIRGFRSYGTIDQEVDPNWPVGFNVAELYGVTKFEPPATLDENALPALDVFHRYTSIEQIQNHPDILKEGTDCNITEKMHGKNTRVGLCRYTPDDSDTEVYEFMAGSHDSRVKETNAKGQPSEYWLPFKMDSRAKDLLTLLGGEDRNNVILFFELYGSGVQDMAYGLKNGTKGYRGLDISVNGKYLNFTEKMGLFDDFEIPTAPPLYRGPWSWSLVNEYTNGPTTMCEADEAGKFKGREGFVVCPDVEQFSGAIGGEGRVIFKSISADYLNRKGGTEFH
jgi:RNA ligase (TIGR02306 family)